MKREFTKTTRYTIILLLMFFVSNFSIAQNINVLKLKSGNFKLTENIHSVNANDFETVKFGSDYFVYVHFKQIPTSAQKKELEAQGVKLLDYVPENSFMAKVNENVNFTGLSSFGVDGIYLMLPEFKMSYELASQNYPEHALNGTRINLIVQNYSEASEQKMDAYYKNLGASIVSHYSFSNLTTIEVSVSNISKIASHPLVKFLEPIAPPAEHEDIVGKSNHRSNYISNPTINAVSYNGDGVWIAIGDDGELGPHIDYTGRMDQTSVGPSGGGHGDHVSGIMMGAGNLDPKAQGMAWGADIKVYDVWDAVNSTPTSYLNPGVIVTSTSYGNGCNAGYTSFAQTADQQVRQMPNLMHVFSAGNSGTSDCNYGAGSGWGNITGGIKAGKNVLAVANVLYTDVLSGSSSRGPASDGRIKPDISANGTSVYSCQENNSYASLSGTSMAAPGVSGTYGQLVHAYKSLNGGVTPPSALVKGALLNTADDLGNVGPDFKFGWGRMNARKVVEVFQNNTFMLDSISQNGSNTHNISIPAGVKQVKIMVYWNDFEGSTVTTLALVNNLDMTVTNPSSTILFPYILDPTPNATNLNTPATNGVDALNNMEQVVIDNPAAGNYSVNVSGTAIPQGPQKYYVIYEFITEDIIVTYPAGGEGFEPGTVETIRWDAPNSTNTFSLEYSINNGSTWTTITSSLTSTRRYYDWNVPTIVTGEALVRITRGTVVGQSQMPFTIIGVPSSINISSSCPNEFDVSWNAVPGATSYEVSVLGAKYMDSVITVNTLTATLSGYSSTNTYWVSVKAKTALAIGKRAIAIEKQPGLWNCSLPYDIALSGVLPSGNAFFDCVDYSNKPVAIKLINTGINAITNVDLAYQFNGATVVTEQYTGTLLPGDTVDFTFSSSISFSNTGTYQLDIWKTTTDDNPSNDTIINPFEVYSSTTESIPYQQNFETFSSCATTSNCGATNCSLIAGWRNLNNGSWDDIDFRVNSGDTPSQNTGPNMDNNPGTSAGKYLYLEASGGCEFNEAQLITPCIDIVNGVNPHASIWYHMLGSDMGELHFDVLSEGTWYNDVETVISGNRGSIWHNQDIDLSDFVGSKINIRFRGITGSGWGSDMALDDFSVFETSLNATIIADSLPCFSNGAVIIDNAPAGTATAYSWNFGAGASPATANTSGPHIVTYSSIGSRTISLTVSNATSSVTDYHTINLTALGTPSFTTFYNTVTDSLEFTNTSTDYATVYWDFGDGTNSTDVHPVHKYPATGYYDVVLTLTNNCGNVTLNQRVDNFPLGVPSAQSTGGFLSVYPNPGNGEVTLEVTEMQGETGHVVIYDVKGNLVYEKSIEISTQNRVLDLNLKHLSKGVYVLGFDSENFNQKIKVVIQ